MGMMQSRIFLVRQIIQHLGWIGVSDTKVKEIALRFTADELNRILRRVEVRKAS